eukprot:COSAG01_NODE_6909_length_3443_cov_13.005981_5_plen_160_part_00
MSSLNCNVDAPPPPLLTFFVILIARVAPADAEGAILGMLGISAHTTSAPIAEIISTSSNSSSCLELRTNMAKMKASAGPSAESERERDVTPCTPPCIMHHAPCTTCNSGAPQVSLAAGAPSSPSPRIQHAYALMHAIFHITREEGPGAPTDAVYSSILK